MSDAPARDRLQPSLLDRLIDEQPQAQHEEPGARVLNRAQLRQAVLRDLAWLMNATNTEAGSARAAASSSAAPRSAVATPRDWQAAEAARHSVVNFGLPAFTGAPASSPGPRGIERAVRQAVLDFEPRILPESLVVKAVTGRTGGPNLMRLSIQGLLWGQPMPLELLLTAEIDCETGVHRVRDQRG